MNKNNVIFAIFAMSVIGIANAHDHSPKVVPEKEYETAQNLGSTGPKETKGIESVTLLGKVSLADEFETLDNREMRAREIIISPGGVVAVHQHDARPGVAYIIEGEIVEHRNDAPEPLLRKAGAVAFEKTGVVHWWENRSDKRVRALVVDIIESKP